MDIVIVANFTGSFSLSDNDRFLYLANMLCKDNDVEIITSSFQHETKKQRENTAYKWPFKITFVEEPGYPRNVCVTRFKSHYKWGKNVARHLRERKEPDVVYCAVPSLTGPSLVAKYCESKGIRFIIDVQDLWPEAFQMVLNLPVIGGVFFAPFKAIANGIYKRADAICAVSDTYCQRAQMVNRKVKMTTTVYLGTELETFDRFSVTMPILEKKEGEIWLAYCGTLGSSYDLMCVIDALAELNDPRLRFIIMGDGPKMEMFKAYAEKRKVRAVFTGRLQYNAMCSLLLACDMTVNPITHGAAQSIINKHADYAASGLPVISTQESGEYRNLVDAYQMGFNCSNSNSIDVANTIKLLADDRELRMKMGANARRCAEERFDRKRSYAKLVKCITNKGDDQDGKQL